MEPDDYPKSMIDFIELRVYLDELKSNLEKIDPDTFDVEMYESYSSILNGIDAALTLAELDQQDDVLHVRDAKSELTKIFGKPIL
jgi:hypothetical protein